MSHSEILDDVVEPLVYLIDSDSESRKSLQEMLLTQGIECVPFDSAERFRSLLRQEPFGCIVIDQHLQESSGIDLLQSLKSSGWKIPMIILASRGEVELCSRAFGLGAADYMEKTAPKERFVAKVRECFALATKHKAKSEYQNASKKKLDQLTDREKEVLNFLVAGHSMKSIASVSGTSFQAVARHRQRILDKLGLENDVILTRWFMEQEFLRSSGS